MNNDENKRLADILDSHHKWPDIFKFKFIYKSNEETLKQLEGLFPDESERLLKHSNKKNYESLTVSHLANNAEEILSLYNKVSKIDGVIVL